MAEEAVVVAHCEACGHVLTCEEMVNNFEPDYDESVYLECLVYSERLQCYSCY